MTAGAARRTGRPVIVAARTMPTVEVVAHPNGMLSMTPNVLPVRAKVHRQRGHLGVTCTDPGFRQYMAHFRGGRTNPPDYYTFGVHLCFIICAGISLTIDGYGRSYLDTSWGWGLGAEAGVTPGFIRNSKPQYHTPGYVENYIRGPGYSLSGGVLFAGVTANHGNPSLCAHLSVCG